MNTCLQKLNGKHLNVSLNTLLTPGDVLLLVPPLADIPVPYIGLHQLEASCRQNGLKTSVLYLNLFYSILLGPHLHNQISLDHTLLTSDRLFSDIAFGHSSIGSLVKRASETSWVPNQCWKLEANNEAESIPPPVVSYRDWLNEINWEKLEKNITSWTRNLTNQVADLGYSIVGASTTFSGLTSAVALLKAVKEINPSITTVLGGSLCDGEMAEGILTLDNDIDYVFSGEGDITFPLLVKKILDGKPPQEKIIYGKPVDHLDNTPIPDFSQFFLQKQYVNRLENSGQPMSEGARVISYETSRGCWVGTCTFCSLTGRKNCYRFKSPSKVIQELKELKHKNQVDIIYMSDCIMPLQYFDSLLPMIARELPGLEIVYEMKPNLTLSEIQCLKSAGVKEIQPGIESLSQGLLKRMKKPCTVRGNLSTLRYARSVGIDIKWVLLFGFPGDELGEYEKILQLLPLIRHLQPPFGMSPLQISRFSKYQVFPDEFGITDLRPADIYQDLFPAFADQDKLAFYFSGEFRAESRKSPFIINRLWKQYQTWLDSWAPYDALKLEFMRPQLHLTRSNQGQYILEDTRGLQGQQERREISLEQTMYLLVSHPVEKVTKEDLNFVSNNGYGVVIDSWLVPLATASPSLLQKFENGTHTSVNLNAESESN